MPPPPHTKPENVHKRAQELIGVGQSLAALNLLHEHLTSKRTRNNPIASLEPVMLLFIELCVDLRKGKQAKDGCYSYKNTAQNTNVGTIELVLKKFIELSENKVKEAQEKAEQVQTSIESQSAAATVDDLEASETPESILLSTVSGEQSKDRTDRAIVTPWLKFLWETYRTVLDILKNNARLEIMYQSTAYQAFEFCQKYTRKTEFRRLCELLRNHLQSAAKYQQQIHSINLSDPDTLQRHLDTRFQQLNVAVELELWQEAFRSIEDIHTLLNLSKRPAKNVMMANYFEKLSTIFLVSENYLFHAAAYSRLFSLLRASAAVVASGQSAKKDNPTISEADITKCASFSILSALAIPVISTSRSRGALVDVDEARKNKNQRLTNLLGLSVAPSRASLFREVQNKGLLKRARPEIRELYTILEVEFHPLSICRKISPILTKIGTDPEMGKYVAPLQQVILTRLFQQLSQVYESVELQYVLDLAQFPDPFQVSKSTIEKFIMNGCKKGDLAIRIDHASGVLTFDSDVFSSAKALHPGSGAGSAESEVGSVQRLQSTPAEIVRSQLSRLAKTLYVTCNYVDPTLSENARRTRAAALARAEQNANKEHMETLERRQVIETRKQTASAAAAAKEKEEATRKRIRAQQQQEAEQQRLADEQRKRDQQKMQAEQARVQREEIQKQVNELKQGVRGLDIDIDSLDLDQIDATKIRQMKISALEREKMDLTRRLNTTGKKLDHLERAYRMEEAKKLPQDYEAQVARDKKEHEQTTAQTLQESKEKHDLDVSLKRRLTRLVPSYEAFRDQIQADRAEIFERRRRAAQKELEAQKQKRVKEHRERKAREKREREQREREQREAAEREEREEAERAAAEEEKKRVLAEQRAKREEERKRDQEKIQQQLQREEEAAARRTGARTGASTSTTTTTSTSTFAASTSTSSTTERRSLFAGARGAAAGGGGWREREAARAAAAAGGGAEGAAPASTSPAPAAAVEPVAAAAAPVPRTGSGYVPPHLRGAGGATGERPPSEASAPSSGGRLASQGARDGGSRWSRPSEGMNGSRGDSPAGAANGADGAPPPARGAGGKYVPGAFRRGQQGGA